MVNEYSCGIVPLRLSKKGPALLLVQHQAGQWAFSKGHPEKGESPKHAAKRELFEETGLRVHTYLSEEPLSEHYFFTFNHQKIFKKVDYFLAVVIPFPKNKTIKLACQRFRFKRSFRS
ncbi:MAG: NUDIX domain-containing protein [Parachlamydia sp.]|jgi:8-oxo-dGTP pyrophosphatase MutT (NUDIX family)|nr:NUDIX domain-containing protein [Parachlamydia sp.]